MGSVRRLLAYLRPYWHLEVATFLLMTVIAVLTLALPVAVQYMIDDLIPGLIETRARDLAPVFYFGLFLAGIYLANVIFSFGRDYFVARIGANIIKDIRAELFDHLQHVSLRFFQQNQIGEIMSRLMSDVGRTQELLTQTLLVFCTNILMLAVILVYLLSVNWLLTVIAVIPVPVTIWMSNRFGRRLHGVSGRLQEAIARLSGRIQEALSGTRTIRAFSQERAELEKAEHVLDGLKGLYVNYSVTTSLAVNFVHFVNMVGPIVVLAWGTYLVASGGIELGALIAFYILLTYLYQPVQDLAGVNVEVQSAMAAVHRIFEYLDLPRAIVDDARPVSLERVHGAIEIRQVSFGYDDSGFALKNLSLAIGAGEKVAIVGPSGSGKTTLVNLVMRFFDPDEGSILLDGVDIRRLPVSFYRSHIGLVEQEPILFKTTIFHNIAYADPSADRQKVQRAAEIANIRSFVERQPQSWDTPVGERGVTVSGGERQRLCLARAILTDPPILILDEATSALDSQSEQLVQQALARALSDKTAIIIAHRLSTVRHADRIVVMDNGQIVSQGTHDILMETSPLYRDLAARQMVL